MPDTRRSKSSLATLLADNASGDISAQDARDEMVSAHPENVIQTAAYASEPSSGQLTGDLFLPSDSVYLERYSGSAWVPWGPLFPLTKPVNGDFSDVGSPTVTTTNGGIILSATANASAYSYKGKKKSAPSTPYTIVAAFLINAVSPTATKVAEAGIHFSDGTKYSSIFYQVVTSVNGAFSVEVDNLSTATSFSASPVAVSYNRPQSCCFLAIGDNGTNRKYGLSANGQTWQTIYSVARTTHLTATEVGFHVNAFNMDVDMTLLSWKEIASDILP